MKGRRAFFAPLVEHFRRCTVQLLAFSCGIMMRDDLLRFEILHSSCPSFSVLDKRKARGTEHGGYGPGMEAGYYLGCSDTAERLTLYALIQLMRLFLRISVPSFTILFELRLEDSNPVSALFFSVIQQVRPWVPFLVERTVPGSKCPRNTFTL